MSTLIYNIFTSTGLTTLGIYHLITTVNHHLKSPTTFISKPYHPITTANHRIRHLPLYITAASLLISSLHHSVSSASPDPLIPSHLFSSLSAAAVSFLFFVVSVSAVFPFVSGDVVFAAASAAFYLLSVNDSSRAQVLNSPSLESHLLLLSSNVSILSSVLSLVLAVNPRLFLADVALSASVILQGLWVLQTGLSLYVDAFIPEGCHKLLDVVGGVEGSTKCELDDSKLRAVALLDFMFVVYVLIVVVTVFAVYGIVSKVTGISTRRLGSYEALPNAVVDGSHVQLKTISGTQA